MNTQENVLRAMWQNRNDTQIPPDTGTRFAIDSINKGPFLFYRIEAVLRLNNKHALRALYAPFEISATGRLSETVNFQGTDYLTSSDLTVSYKFNSYRLSYIYGFWGFDGDQLNIGFTGKIRDADTTFTQSGASLNYDNVGFVPLFYFAYLKTLNQNWKFHLTLDAAAAPQGRAFDAGFKFHRTLGKNSQLGIGLRSLEGGAANEKVFTFSWFNYALLDYTYSF